jgi:hypothetical protein
VVLGWSPGPHMCYESTPPLPQIASITAYSPGEGNEIQK